jgi:hypothetical protein
MKKCLFIILIILSVFACKKKTEFSPEGPTDVRIRNLSDVTWQEVTVDIDTVVHYGTIAAGGTSDYMRFPKAYPKATITAKIIIGGSPVTFSTGVADYTYMQYLGQDKVTYEVYISNMNKNELAIHNVIHEEPLVLK